MAIKHGDSRQSDSKSSEHKAGTGKTCGITICVPKSPGAGATHLFLYVSTKGAKKS